MASLLVSDRSPKLIPKKQMRRMNPHMDFTPMVDLGFLLITFFMLTTSLAKPVVMPLVMPDKEGIVEPLKQSKALTVLLGKDNKVYWYEGMDMGKMDSTSFEKDGLRQVILEKMKKVQDKFGFQAYHDVRTGIAHEGSYLNVLIKPGELSSYKNLVDVLDEMNICRVRYYCILNPTTEEAQKLK